MIADTFANLTRQQQQELLARTRARADGKPLPVKGRGIWQIDENGNRIEDTYTQEELDTIPLPMPLNFLCDSGYTELTNQLDSRIRSTFEQYLKGNFSMKDVTQTLDDAVSSLIERYTRIGFEPAEITPKIIEDVYSFCRSTIPRQAQYVSWQEGNEIAKQFPEYKDGGHLYYSADLYHKTEETIDAVLENAQKQAEKYGVASKVTLERHYSTDTSTSRLMKSLHESYNTEVNTYYRDKYVSTNLIDETMVPPKGFRMFYTQNDRSRNHYAASMGPGDDLHSVFDGGVHIWYGDWSFSRRVPINMEGPERPIATNLLDVVKNAGCGYPEALTKFLANIDFYSPALCAEYRADHPRKF